MSVLCKFLVSGIALEPYGGWQDTPKVVGRRIKMTGVQSEPFGNATRQASCEMLILNAEAANFFQLEGEYTVEFRMRKAGLPVIIVDALPPAPEAA